MPRDYRTLAYPVLESGKAVTIYGWQDDNLVYSVDNPRNSKGVYVSGGPFFVQHKVSKPLVGRELNWKFFGNPSVRFTPWTGSFTRTPAVPQTPSAAKQVADIALADTWAFGSTGWKRTAPGAPKLDFAAFTGEMVQGLPTLPLQLFRRLIAADRSLQAIKQTYGKSYQVSGEWLNWQFGWFPLVSDLQKLYKTWSNIDRLLAQIARDNGRGIRRRVVLRDSTDVAVVQQNFNTVFVNCFGFPSALPSGTTRWEVVTTTKDKVWFAARYRYYIPDVGESQWTRRARRALFGAYPTPNTLYQLLPWSWLIDYFGNVGDLVSNMGSRAVDNLTADYAYVMRQRETTVETHMFTRWNSQFAGGSNVPAGDMRLSGVTQTTITKARAVGSPYGFGLTYDGLSLYQKSILAALGISRSRF